MRKIRYFIISFAGQKAENQIKHAEGKTNHETNQVFKNQEKGLEGILSLLLRETCVNNLNIKVKKSEALKPVKTHSHLKQYFDWLRSKGQNDHFERPKVILSYYF